MPNPYDDIFDNSGEKKKSPEPEFTPHEFADDRFKMNAQEPLDEILESIKKFQQQAGSFSKLLSQTKAIDHKVEGNILKYFLVTSDKFDQRSLGGEKKYHELLTSKIKRIIAPMRELAKLHLATIQQFNRDIDKNYFSIEKTDDAVKSEK
jgi:hypothetical protein